ncbi:unnamed protein product [Adineta ricciae]|uniref:Uncharacterized protein n=1 Tax=Adineta ricciae TaxID=249248 RepID=A0A813YK22_ADIRI|nr:unnamed protein product [Adineta ricciae]CAF0936711.1 unnamed protein product [Adineta ricciae]
MNDTDLNIEALIISKQPITCSIRADLSPIVKQSNEVKSDRRINGRENTRRSSTHLPVTYSTSIYIPYHSSWAKPRLFTISPTQSSGCHHHCPKSPTSIQQKTLTSRTANSFNRPTTISTMTQTSPGYLSVSKTRSQYNRVSLSDRLAKEPLRFNSSKRSTCSTLVYNWFCHLPGKISSLHKERQSDNSKIHRHRLLNKLR